MLINTPRHQLTALFNRKKIHYGWLMVILAFTHSMFSAAAMGVPSVLIVPMAEDLGWTIGELSAPQGLRLALIWTMRSSSRRPNVTLWPSQNGQILRLFPYNRSFYLHFYDRKVASLAGNGHILRSCPRLDCNAVRFCNCISLVC